jgi:hypothetical protein
MDVVHTELAIGNIVRRVLHMIREEQQQEQLDHSTGGQAAQDAADQQQVCCKRTVCASSPHVSMLVITMHSASWLAKKDGVLVTEPSSVQLARVRCLYC